MQAMINNSLQRDQFLVVIVLLLHKCRFLSSSSGLDINTYFREENPFTLSYNLY